MKNKSILPVIKLLALFLCLLALNRAQAQASGQRAYYQLTVYHFKDSVQENTIDQYLQQALLPALHKMNMKSVGVFKTISNDTAADKTMYVLIPVRSLNEIADMTAKLTADAAYNKAGAGYLDATYDTAPYTRMETIVLHAFEKAPRLTLPQLKNAHSDRVYELRSYESATEKLYASKVKMFNTGDEVGIFSKLNFNPVFYAEVIAGSHMPNLMYMTTFENKEARETHWKAFSDSPAFKALLAMPEYQHNVSKADIIFLRPTEYSDI